MIRGDILENDKFWAFMLVLGTTAIATCGTVMIIAGRIVEHTYDIQARLWFMGHLMVYLSIAFMVLSLACLIHARVNKGRA